MEDFFLEGTVKKVRQVTARFTLPTLVLRIILQSIVLRPAKADGRNRAYDFDEDLCAGVRCRFGVKDGLAALDGAPVTGGRTFSFDTGGPAIMASFPWDGCEAIDEEQAFLLKLDAPATIDTVRQHAYFIIDGVSEQVPIEILTGDARKAIVAHKHERGMHPHAPEG